MSQCLHDNADAKATAIRRVFPENSRAKNEPYLGKGVAVCIFVMHFIFLLADYPCNKTPVRYKKNECDAYLY